MAEVKIFLGEFRSERKKKSPTVSEVCENLCPLNKNETWLRFVAKFCKYHSKFHFSNTSNQTFCVNFSTNDK